MNFKNYLKTKLRYVFGVAAIAALLSQLIAPILAVRADGPRFNFLTGDYQLLEGQNTTKGDSVWKNPVTGIAGDEFRGSVYYHNGMVDTTATNTKIKINIPAKTVGSTAKITASISADNAETVTSTIVDGQLVGLDGLVVNLDKDAELDLVPGSVKWFPNSSTSGGVPVALPNGQSGNEIISGSGVNIGGIEGCWQYAGFVTFAFKTKVTEAPAFTIDKTVRNATKNGVSFAKETSANIGDETEFNIDVTNSGNITAADGVIHDTIPAGLEFVSGSLKKVIGGIVTALPDTEATKFVGAGIAIDNLAPGSKISYLFTTKVTSTLKGGDSVTNIAFATAFALTKESSAKVTVATAYVPTPNIVKSKSAFNDTKNKPTSETKNNIGDNITYTLNTSNTGDASIDYEIKDDISEVLANASVIAISNSGQVIGNEIKWPIVTINPGEKIVRTFQVKVKTVVNGARFRNVYGNEVVVVIDVPPVVLNPCLHIEKLVRDVTTNDGAFVDNNKAYAGDTLEYLINFSNTGNGPADRVKISDILPANTQYVAGTTRISRNGGSEQTLPDGITGAGIVLDTVPAGDSDCIKFRVITSSNIAANEILVNTATINGISDTATTTIIAKPIVAAVTPVLPKTGATGAGSFLITSLLGVAFLYCRYKKLAISEEVMIINSMLA